MNTQTRGHISRVSLLTAGALLIFGTASIKAAPAAPASASAASQGITLNLQNAPVQTVLKDLFAHAGKNYSMDPNVSGNVTVDVNNVPFDQALAAVLGGTYPPLAAPLQNGGIYHVEYASQQVQQTPPPVNVAQNNANNDTGTPSTANDPRHFYPPIKIKHYDAYDMAMLVAMFSQKGGMPTMVMSEPLAMSSGMGGGMGGGMMGGGMGGGMMGGGMGGGMMGGGMGGGMMGGGMGGGRMGGGMGGGMMGGGMGGGMMGGGMGGGMMGGGMY